MIETYFGLSRRPFLAVPDVQSYFPSETIDSARTNVLRCLHRGEGISLVIGQSGIGKTLLLRLLGLPFHLDYAVVNISNHRLKTPKAFLQQVLFELQQPFCGSDENELRLLLWDHLRRSSLPGVILLVDEGQTLSLSVLEEIRQMLNCDNGLLSRFRIAIAGTLELEERLTHPKLKTFNQWIVSRSYLEPLTRSETSKYILWQTQNARKSEADENETAELPSHGQSLRYTESADSTREYRLDPPHRHSEQFPLFDDHARTKIYELTGGIPRIINQLCDHTLVLACEASHAKTIDESLVRSAWASLQQIPESKLETKCFAAGTNLPNAVSPNAVSLNENVIEFGTLDDDSPIGSSNESEIFEEEEDHTPPFFSGDDDTDDVDTEAVSDEELELLFKGTTLSHQVPTQQAPAAPAEEPKPVAQKPDEHVYQVKSFYKAAYPNGPEQVMNNWTSPDHQVSGPAEYGVGTPYREILYRDLARQSRESAQQDIPQTAQSVQAAQMQEKPDPPADPLPVSVALPPGMVVTEAKRNDSRLSLPDYVSAEQLQDKSKAGSVPVAIPAAVVSNDPISRHQPRSAVIRLHLGSESERRPVEPNCLKSGRLKSLQESFEEEIPVPKAYRPKEPSLVLSQTSLSQEDTEIFSDPLVTELKQMQQSLAQGIAFRSVKRVASLLEETQKGSEGRSQTLRFDPDASKNSAGSALPKPKFHSKPAAEEEFITLDFQQESQKVAAKGKENGVKKQESRKMWIHSEPKAKDRPPLKLRKPTEETDTEEIETPSHKKSVADFDAFFSKFYG